MPMVILASMELMIFATALLLAHDPVRLQGIEGLLPRGLLFLTLMSFAMAAMGLYNARQVLTPVGMLLRIVIAAAGGSALIALISQVIPDLALGASELITSALLVIAGSFSWHLLLDRIARNNAF